MYKYLTVVIATLIIALVQPQPCRGVELGWVPQKTCAAFTTTGNFSPTTKLADVIGPPEPAPQAVQVYYNGKWWKAKLMEKNGGRGRIHWVQLGYDSSDQDEWIDLTHVRPLAAPTNL